MSDRIDPNETASFLDGRLRGPRRDEFLARLAASDQALDDFVDTAEVLIAVEEAGAAVRPVIPLAARRRPRWILPLGVLAAAAAIAAVTVFGRGRSAEHAWRDPEALGAVLARGGGLPATWDRRPWDEYRGGTSPVVGNGRSARIGALLVDLSLAARSRDADATARLAGDVQAQLADFPAAAAVAQEYAAVGERAGADPAELAPALERAREHAGRITSPEPFALGAWAEAARLAALRGDAGFFHSAASRRALDHAAASPVAGDLGRAAAGRIRSRTDGREPRDWSSLRADIGILLQSLAG